jgi:hypothetical protein
VLELLIVQGLPPKESDTGVWAGETAVELSAGDIDVEGLSQRASIISKIYSATVHTVSIEIYTCLNHCTAFSGKLEVFA